MSDYFTALAARAVEAPGAVVPRPRSRYEPISIGSAGAPNNGAVDHGAETDGAVASTTGAVRPRDGASQIAGAERSADAIEAGLDAAPATGRGRRVPRTKGNGQADGGRRGEDIGGRPEPHPTVRVATSERRGSSVSEVTIAPSRLGSPDHHAAPSSSRLPRDEHGSQSRSTGSTDGRLPQTPRRVATPVADATSEPTIRIHIGRVDVRAIVPASPVASPPKPADLGRSALMTLDEYVQQRRRTRG